MTLYTEGHEFSAQTGNLAAGEYENCTFEDCQFINLSGCNFVDCRFARCDLSNAILGNTTLNGVEFQHCKLVGIQFDTCSEFLFDVSFDTCNLSLCSFYKRNMHGTVFNLCNLTETDFTEADCTEVCFDMCRMSLSVFENTTLNKTNFYTSEGFSIDPDKNRISKCIFSSQNVLGLLTNLDIEIRP